MKLLKKVDLSFSCNSYFSFFYLEILTFDIYDNNGIIHSKNYPEFLRTNIEYIWNIHMNNSNELEIDLIDIHLDYDHDYLQIITGNNISVSLKMKICCIL
jgi:hypothetical protein